MPTAQTRYTHEEFGRRGDEWYDLQIKPLESEQHGKIVAIDIESGSYEIDANELAATKRLTARLPDAQIWLRRIGFPYLHRIGPGQRMSRP